MPKLLPIFMILILAIASDYLSYICRAGADDKPLRMVKTVLHELVKLRGTSIKGHLSMVPIDMEPQPIILAYIDLNLQVNQNIEAEEACLNRTARLLIVVINICSLFRLLQLLEC